MKFAIRFFAIIGVALGISSCAVDLSTKGGFGEKVNTENHGNISNIQINEKIEDLIFKVSVKTGNSFIKNTDLAYLESNILNVLKTNRGLIQKVNSEPFDLSIHLSVTNFQTQKYSDCYRTFVDYELIVSDYNNKTVCSKVASIAGRGKNANTSATNATEIILNDIFESRDFQNSIRNLNSGGEKDIYQHKIDMFAKDLMLNFRRKLEPEKSVRIAVRSVKNDQEGMFYNMLISSVSKASGKFTEVLNRSDLNEVIEEKALSMSGLTDNDTSDSKLKTPDYLLVSNISGDATLKVLSAQIVDAASGEIVVSNSISFNK